MAWSIDAVVRRCACGVAAITAAGCGSPPPPSAPAAAAVGTARLTVTGTVRGAGTTTALEEARVVHSNDLLYLFLRADRPVDAYVAYCNSRGSLEVYPRSGAIALPAEREIRVPESTEFRIDPNPGQETLYVIASTRPLRTSDPSLHSALAEAARKPGGKPCTVTPPPRRRPKPAPGPSPARREAEPKGVPQYEIPEVPPAFRPRGIVLNGEGSRGRVIETGADGVAILPFTFRHDP